MEMCFLDVSMLLFKILCGIVTLFMVGFWVDKFHKNEDVSQVQYISLKDADEVILPETTICIRGPFLVQPSNESVNVDGYLEYLNGFGDHHEKYKNIGYMNVTINIFDYLQYPILVEKDDSPLNQTTCTGPNNCRSIELRNSFNGFSFKSFYKCFSIGINPKYAQNISMIVLRFDPLLAEKLKQMQEMGSGTVYLTTNYRHQVSKYVEKYQLIWQTASERNMNTEMIISNIEILKRRNKRGDPCIENWRDFDNWAINEHIDRVGCSNPYLIQGKLMCSNATKMKESKYLMNIIDFNFNPCQGMSNADIKYIENPYNSTTDSRLWLRIQYPSEIKMITQTQSVDLHSLVGNIGGYIGLFLGMNSIGCTVRIRPYVSKIKC